MLVRECELIDDGNPLVVDGLLVALGDLISGCATSEFWREEESRLADEDSLLSVDTVTVVLRTWRDGCGSLDARWNRLCKKRGYKSCIGLLEVPLVVS